jgi:hypothetical protein
MSFSPRPYPTKMTAAQPSEWRDAGVEIARWHPAGRPECPLRGRSVERGANVGVGYREAPAMKVDTM